MFSVTVSRIFFSDLDDFMPGIVMSIFFLIPKTELSTVELFRSAVKAKNIMHRNYCHFYISLKYCFMSAIKRFFNFLCRNAHFDSRDHCISLMHTTLLTILLTWVGYLHLFPLFHDKTPSLTLVCFTFPTSNCSWKFHGTIFHPLWWKIVSIAVV